MTPAWDAPHLLLLWAMWAVMMIAMMLPSAAPLILLYGAAARRRAAGSPQASVYALALGYVTLWALFSVAATAAQRVLGETLVMSPMMELTLPAASSALLVFAGLYQLTRIKSICLGVCQSPLGFLMAHWRDGAAGAFRLGLRHGLYCLGCCWALMLLLFVGGVMNLTAIVGLTVFIALEKSRWLGRWGSRASGGLLIALGLLTLADVL
jgi:predicted metal-binding membrane protein